MTAAAWTALVIALVALLVLGLWLLIGWFGAWRLNRGPSLTPEANFAFTPWEFELDHTDIEFTTEDGVRLHGWFLSRPESRRTVIVMHGYRGHKGQLLGISSYLWRSGFNVLMFDFRGRGASDRAPISMGLWERVDLEAALNEASRRVRDARIGLLGYSMGGVVALLGGGDPRVTAVVADSAFADQRGVLEHVARTEARAYLRGVVDGRVFLPVIEWWHRRRGKPPFSAIAPERAIEALEGKPVLLIHGTRDALVPAEQVERLAERIDTAEEWLVKGAYHCGAYFVDRPAYSARVTAFFNRHLPDAAS